MIVVLIVGTGLGLLWWRIEPFVHRVVSVHETLAHVQERTVAVAEKQAERPKALVRDDMPVGLVNIAARESEPWAREDKIRLYNEQYDQVGDWGRVLESAMGN